MSPPAPSATIYTIGHSNHGLDDFLTLLKHAGITAVADVRTQPFSRRQPHFNHEPLAAALRARDVAYSFLGKELGGRPEDPALWRADRPDYERMATAPRFCEGLARVAAGSRQFTLALMCAEKEPLDCHRCLLVARALADRGTPIRHVLADGRQEIHAETEARLLAWAGRRDADMFDDQDTRRAAAYRKRAAWLWGERT